MPITYPSKVIVLGGNGMLGSSLSRVFASHNSQTTSCIRNELDVTNPDAVWNYLKANHPRIVINATGYTDVDRAEKEPDLAWQLNAVVPKRLVEVCRELSCTLVHFSTDQVFDGTLGRPVTEVDLPTPCNVYAKSKYEGERAVADYEDSLVFRVQWLYGEKKDRFRTLATRTEFTPFIDQFGSPTWTERVSQLTWASLSRGTRGLYHIAYDDYASWMEIFEFVKNEMGYSVELKPITTEAAQLPAKRPLFSVLSNRKLLDTLGLEKLGSWRDDLKRFLHPSS